MAFVFSVIFSFIFEGSRLYVLGLISTNTGIAPNLAIQPAVAKKLNKEIKNSASIIARNVGSGSVILFADNPHFRAFWFGTEGLFLNAILFGKAF